MTQTIQHSPLVFGGTGMVGAAVLDALAKEGVRAKAVSRQPIQDEQHDWLQAGFEQANNWPNSHQSNIIISTGPLRAFADWLTMQPWAEGSHVVAFSSTSAVTKANSTDAQEHQVAHTLQQAEQDLAEWAAKTQSKLLVLRPTMIYGAGRDLTLSRLASIAMKLGHLPLPQSATGLRQPVHCDDLANVVLAALVRPHVTGVLNVPGGETLAFDDMVERMLSCLPNTPKLWRIPDALFLLAMRGMRSFSASQQAWSQAKVQRLQTDLCFSADELESKLNVRLRAFDVRPECFVP